MRDRIKHAALAVAAVLMALAAMFGPASPAQAASIWHPNCNHFVPNYTYEIECITDVAYVPFEYEGTVYNSNGTHWSGCWRTEPYYVGSGYIFLDCSDGHRSRIG